MADVKRLLWSARNKKSGYSKIPSLAVGKKKWLHTKQNQGVQKKSKKISDVLEEVIPRRRAMSCMWLQGQNTARQFSLKGEQ